jgi:peptide/nickel transport system substrate-binding protein
LALYTKGKTLKKIDDYTIHIITEKPYPLMPNDVSTIYIISKKNGMGASNRGRYSNPEVDRLIQQALATVDDSKREKILQRATEIAIGELGIIPLHYQVNTWATRKGLAYTPRTDEYTMAMSVVVK